MLRLLAGWLEEEDEEDGRLVPDLGGRERARTTLSGQGLSYWTEEMDDRGSELEPWPAIVTYLA